MNDNRSAPTLQRVSNPKARSLVIALVGFCAFLNLYTPQPLLPLFTEVFDASEVEVSFIVSATALGIALAAPWVGMLADRIGRKWVIVPALFLLTVPTFLAATSNGLLALIEWRFWQGICMAVIFAVSMAYISEEAAATGVSKPMSIYITGNVVGGFVGRFLAGVIATHATWRWAFVIMGSLTLVGAIAAARWLPRSQTFHAKPTLHLSLHAIRSHLQNPRLVSTFIVGFNLLFSIVALFTYVNFYLSAAPFRLNAAALGTIFCVYLVGAVITPIAGQWSARLGYQTSMIMAIALVSVGVLLTLPTHLAPIIAGLSLSATGIFMGQAIATSYVSTATCEARSSATGLYVAAYYLGGSMGAVIPGYFWSAGGWLACVGLILAVQIMIACLVLTFWRT